MYKKAKIGGILLTALYAVALIGALAAIVLGLMYAGEFAPLTGDLIGVIEGFEDFFGTISLAISLAVIVIAAPAAITFTIFLVASSSVIKKSGLNAEGFAKKRASLIVFTAFNLLFAAVLAAVGVLAVIASIVPIGPQPQGGAVIASSVAESAFDPSVLALFAVPVYIITASALICADIAKNGRDRG
ncbi:MAG: hypothetical protein LBP79_06320 [Clostridiales bacterium]|jgi:hypothetical protein|nr:hypothetical protein [Clostridiales bacterium]